MIYACLKNNVVVKIQDLTEEQYRTESLVYDMIVDITNDNPQPIAGYVLSGNKIVQTTPQIEESILEMQQTAQRIHGEGLAKIAVDKMGARNLKLAKDGVAINVMLLSQQLQGIKLLLEGGALKTVRGLCSTLKSAFPHHADILQLVIDDITNFLVRNGYE